MGWSVCVGGGGGGCRVWWSGCWIGHVVGLCEVRMGVGVCGGWRL